MLPGKTLVEENEADITLAETTCNNIIFDAIQADAA
jgi:hypothetical protein